MTTLADKVASVLAPHLGVLSADGCASHLREVRDR